MDAEIIRENIDAQRVVNLKPALVTVEAEAALPGSLRERADVYLADAEAFVLGAEVAGGRVTVEGRVRFHAVYAQGDLGKLTGADAARGFTQQLNAPGELKGDTAEINLNAEVQQVSTRVFNGRLLFKATIQVSGQALLTEPASPVGEIKNAEGLETRYASVKSVHAVGRGETESLIQKELPLPESMHAAEALFGTASAQVEDITGGADGRIGVSGTIRLLVYLSGKEGSKPLLLSRHEVPFEQSVVLSGALGEAVRASAEVYDVAVALKDGEGAPIVRAEVLVHTKAVSFSENERMLLNDLYGVEAKNVEAVTLPLSTTREIVETSAAESGKLQLTLPEGSQRISEPLAAQIRPVLLEAKRANDKLIVDGAMLCTFVYLTDGSNIPVSVSTEEPFTMEFKTNALPEDVLRLAARDVEASALTGDRVEIKYILRLAATGFRQDRGEYVGEILYGEDALGKEGIDLYFVQPEESLWQLGKRTHTAVETLKQLNPQLNEQLKAGEIVMTYRG